MHLLSLSLLSIRPSFHRQKIPVLRRSKGSPEGARQRNESKDATLQLRPDGVRFPRRTLRLQKQRQYPRPRVATEVATLRKAASKLRADRILPWLREIARHVGARSPER